MTYYGENFTPAQWAQLREEMQQKLDDAAAAKMVKDPRLHAVANAIGLAAIARLYLSEKVAIAEVAIQALYEYDKHEDLTFGG